MTIGGLSDRVAKLAMDGMTISEIADELDLSYDGVRHHLYRAGIRARRETSRTIRDKLEVLKPMAAVEYLLGIIENYEMISNDHHEIDQMPFNLTPTERRLMMALYNANGRMVTKETLYNAMYIDALPGDDPRDDKIVNVLICKIRQKMPESIGRIETVWGTGFRFFRAEVKE